MMESNLINEQTATMKTQLFQPIKKLVKSISFIRNSIVPGMISSNEQKLSIQNIKTTDYNKSLFVVPTILSNKTSIMKALTNSSEIQVQGKPGNQLQDIAGTGTKARFISLSLLSAKHKPMHKFLALVKTMTLVLILLFSASFVQATAKTASVSGPWSSITTWGGRFSTHSS